MKTLKERFAEAATKYPALKKACEAQVVRWEWASFGLYHPKPFFNERKKIGKGRKLDGKPATIKSGMRQYGFDSDDRIVVVRQYTEFSGRFYEEFFVATEDQIEGTHFDPYEHKPVGNVTRQTFKDGRIISFGLWGTNGESTEAYQYNGDRITSIKTIGTNFLPRKEYSIAETIGYDEIGRLSLIQREFSEGNRTSKEILYKRPRKGESVNELVEIIRGKLVRQIPETLRAARIADRVYCLILPYTKEDAPVLPPEIALGLDRQRKAWVKEKGKDAKGYVWNAAEFERSGDTALTLDDAELIAACDLFNQQIALNGKWNLTRKLLNEVARELMQMNWKGTLAVTDDFIVFALDYEETDFRANLKASVSPVRLAMLKAKGLL